ncbi:Y14336 putative extracellular protein containing predicted 35aa signal peptide [Bradyrhizobium sp.]|uniref:GlcG/HbpS family heme-binding protein n=1 Tax=Bradyrhizobium sp. TaxID=376 RepID=UPI0007C1A922|nr:heme-binding protein [Bradyrhizobium sp.]CUT10512.1 Y14336 putative extracellular protein containing predicted 35aa signal peptide [Bradyrhizobium sp.]
MPEIATKVRCLSVATALLIASICPLQAEEGLVAYKSLGPELALDLARAALANCRTRGYQVAVAVVDRFGVTQVMLRDRFAGPHTPSTAAGKAWTAASFKTSTAELNAISQPGMMQAGIRNLPGAVVIAGGLIVEAGGSLVGAVGVSGAPGGDADEACAKAGIDAIRDKLDF